MFDPEFYRRYAQDMPFRGPEACTEVPEWSPNLRKNKNDVNLTSFWNLREPRGGVLILLRALRTSLDDFPTIGKQYFSTKTASETLRSDR